MHTKTFRSAVAGLLLMILGCDPAVEPAAPPAPRVVEAPDSRVVVHLFEWRWDDVAEECETFLGPMGYRAVQVSPVTENAVVEGRPWYERYQPASYRVGNRSGNRVVFAGMVSRCRAAGVDIYVDAILNHMTGVYAGVGTSGTTFGEYDYPGLYSYDDFHHCGLTGEGDEIQDWNDPVQFRLCELVNLADLATEKENVRDSLAAYLNDLVGLGVAGFRLDAAKHMAPEDVAAILARVEGAPFIYQEVSDPQRWGAEYFPTGQVTEFQYSYVVSDVFLHGGLARLHGAGSIWETTPFLPSDSALVFIDNHDNQRHDGGVHVVKYKDGPLYDLAVAFMLAYPYGTARVMSSYAFEAGDQAPPMTEEVVKRVHGPDGLNCGQGEWVCEHRRPTIAPMVRFRTVTVGAPVANWWVGGEDRIAFSRGEKGFFVINRSDAAMTEVLQTGLAAGTYCNVLDGGLENGVCTGGVVVVGPDGTAAVTVPPMKALALHIEAKATA